MNAQPLGTGNVPFHPSGPQLFEHISSYPFHTDSDYQSGLSAILGHPETPATQDELSQNQDLVLQAQCFYLARRYGLPTVDIAGYQRWLSNQHSESDTQASTQPQTEDPPPSIPTALPAPTPATAAPPSPFPRPRAPTPNTAAQATTHPLSPSSSSTTTTTQPISSNIEANTTNINPANTLPPSSDAVPPYPTTFADIVTLITENKPIPGIQEIPPTILEPGSSKQDTVTRRRKPWEKHTEEEGDTHTTNDDGTDIPSAASIAVDADKDEQIDTDKHRETGEGVLKILQPGAVPDSGLIAKE